MDDNNDETQISPQKPGQDETVEPEDQYDEFDEDYEDPEELVRNIADNPLMERVQAALYQQIKNSDDRVTLELREQSEELRRAKQRREDIGVELYGVQQQLAKLQMELENRHNTFNMVQEIRLKTEDEYKQVAENCENFRAEVAEEEKKLAKNQIELDALNATLRQVEQYNEEMKSEIAVTRRATYKAEENVGDLEKAKNVQDVYIDSLTEELKRLHQQHALYSAQLSSQHTETAAAAETLSDASAEMSAIQFEIKQLMQQWKSSLVGMQRRDEALQATTEALERQQEEARSIGSEIEGYKASVSKEQAENERLTGVKHKVESETRFLEEQLSSIRSERERLGERFGMLKKSLEQTDRETGRVDGETAALAESTAGVDSNLQVVERERQKLEASIAQHKSTQTTVSKAARNLSKTAAEVQGSIHEKEVEASGMQNELARIRVDSLNTEAHNTQLGETLEKLVEELKEKDGLIEKYELEIRQRNDEIEKKMYIVDRLNRKYEQLTAGVEDENLGPLEATIKNLGKAITRFTTENREMEWGWLKTQTELVGVVNATQAQTAQVRELTSQDTILNQKRIRLDAAIAKHGAELSQLRNNIRGMHNDMSRLNSLIAKNSELQERLANSNFALETDFVNELREMETASITAAAEIGRLKEEKAGLLEEIVEAERQIMLWEKKIQLEKETQLALDPEVGQAEALSMEKEIHRMRLRYETLKRDQERMIAEMERSIFKREAIALRHKNKKSGDMTMASLKKKLMALRGSLRKTKASTAKFEGAIQRQLRSMEEVGSQLEVASADYSSLEDEANELQRTINNALYEKQRSLDAISKTQRLASRYEALRAGRRPPQPQEAQPALEAELARESGAQQAIRDTMEHLKSEHPHLDEVLERVMKLTEI